MVRVVVAYCSLLMMLLPLLKLRRRNLLKFVTLLTLHPFVTNYHSRMNSSSIHTPGTSALKHAFSYALLLTTLATDAYHDIFNSFFFISIRYPYNNGYDGREQHIHRFVTMMSSRRSSPKHPFVSERRRTQRLVAVSACTSDRKSVV